jgi:hypothetical protein
MLENYWKQYCRFFWKNDFRWEVTKAKTYTSQEIQKYCHALNIVRDMFLERDRNEVRPRFVKFCSNKKEINYEFSGRAHETFLTIEAFNKGLITIQPGLNNSGTTRHNIVDDCNSGSNFEQLVDKYGRKIVDDFAANTRNFLNWWDDWGYAVRAENRDGRGFLLITEIGHDAADNFNDKSTCLAIFRDQLKKYQIPNYRRPQRSLLLEEAPAIKPYYGIVQILLKVPKNRITKKEYMLFVSKTKDHTESEIGNTVEQITRFRGLTDEEQKNLLRHLSVKDPKKRKNGRGISISKTEETASKALQAFALISGDLFRWNDDVISIPRKNIRRAKEIVRSFENEPIKQYHEFRDSYEYNLSIGKRDYDNVDEILKRNYFSAKTTLKESSDRIGARYSGITPAETEKNRDILLEIQLQKYYEKNIDQLNTEDRELEIKTRPGFERRETMEYNTLEVGEIDLLCVDKISKEYFVIEIKREEADGKAMGQLLQYMGWVHQRFEKRTHGILITKKTSDKFNYAKNFIKSNVGPFDHIEHVSHNFSSDNPPPAET